MEKIWETAKEAILRTIDKLQNLLLLLTFLSLGLSFVSYKNQLWTFPTASPNYYFITLAAILLVFTIVAYIRTKNVKTLKKQTKILLNSCEIIIKVGNIQDAERDREEFAIILPVNTTFTDECITDKKSALGSFFDTFHSSKIFGFIKDLQRILEEKGIERTSDGRYLPCTTIILPETYSLPAKLILVASTEKLKQHGFRTSPSMICDCIYNIFKETSDQRISTISLPLIGSGHGGLNHAEVLNLLLLSISFHLKNFTHIKKVSIFVRDQDREKINASFINSFQS
jgi:O-acetyl-ADP-ribose deacetylase (regulator of RNase III)